MPDFDSPTEILEELRRDFRRHLETFYMQLKLAPPYDHLEKAVSFLLSTLKTMTGEAQETILHDARCRWICYRDAFIASGLHRKHRGIIAGLSRSGAASGLAPEYRVFLDACVAAPPSGTAEHDPGDAAPSRGV